MRWLRPRRTPIRSGVLVELDYASFDDGTRIPIAYLDEQPTRKQLAFVEDWLRDFQGARVDQPVNSTEAYWLRLERAKRMLNEPIR